VSLRHLLACLLIAIAPTAIQAQDGNTDIIRGRVTGPDSLPLENATVSVQSVSTQATRTTRTGRDGRYTVVFANGGGDYIVTFTQIGYQPRSFQVKREADEAVLIADARLTRNAVLLDPIRVAAQRQRPQRNDMSPDIGGSERNMAAGGVPIDKLGDLAEMAASLPGVSLIPSLDGPAGFSVLGLGPDANNITLNGMNFDGTNIPRDAMTMTRMSTSTFDVSRGGFSGAQISMRSFGGSPFVQRSVRLTVDEPHLQWTDRTGSQFGQQYTNLQVSGTTSGPIVQDKLFYNTAYQFGRRTSDLQTLLNTDAFALQAAGVSQDSVIRLETLLANEGVPVWVSGIPGTRQNDNASIMSQFDIAPGAQRGFNFTINGGWNRSGAAMMASRAFPSHGGETRDWNAGLQGSFHTYFGFGILNKTSASFQTRKSSGSGYLDLPDAVVRINSEFPDGSSNLSSVQFGGNSSLPRGTTNQSWELQNESSWFTKNNKHRYKFTVDAGVSRYDQDQTFNRLGTFTYNSIADFEAGVPASFSRRLSPRERNGSIYTTAWSLGDAWRPSRQVQVQYGLRVDGYRFGAQPQYNARVEELFDVRNDHVPNGVSVSPRLGFSWNYGTAPQIAGFEGAQRGSRGQISGGTGIFQGTPGATFLGNAIDNTGLPDGAQQLSCVGVAVPTPDWELWAANPGMIPERCADGTTGTVFSSSVPNVSLIGEDYRPQRSWRSNLAWQLPILKNRFRARFEGTLSLNMQQSGSVDLNFDRQPRFALANEGNRPVYAADTSIVPITGAIATRDARITQEFAQVSVQRSDLRSASQQLSASIGPTRFSTTFGWSLTYQWQNVRDLRRGFGGSTAGDPLVTEWARAGGDWRHMLSYNMNYTVKQAVRFSLNGRFTSGTPYTPMIAGDINGDGYSNDRAFVFNPEATADPVLASAMRSMLDGASPSVRECLTSQFGRVAGRNSCQGPWTTNMNLSISLVSEKVKLPNRATVSLGIANPLTGIDALVHGGTSRMHGWGQSPSPDGTLLYVKGFDQASRSYVYDVNQRFGDTQISRTGLRNPFRVTLDVRVNVAPDMERQQLERQLSMGRTRDGNRMTENQIKQRYARGMNPFDQLLRQRDSLKLTQEQIDSIASIQRQYNMAQDSIWSPVAKYLASLGEKYDAGAAYDRMKTAQNASLDRLQRLGPKAKAVLTPEQVRLLPPFISLYLDAKAIRQIRPGRQMFEFGGR
jgi:hypothetical protein